jgi:predicted nicotinamide N-methyase
MPFTFIIHNRSYCGGYLYVQFQLFLYRAIFWPGGQSLCRFILDGGPEFPAGNSKFSGKFLAGKRVLDLGCGSGAASIAAVMSGAKKPVFANDIDQVNCMALMLKTY